MNVLEINSYRNKLLQILNDELTVHRSYVEWMDELVEFRNQLKMYTRVDEGGRVHPKNTLLNNGHILDHHVIGYFAPLDFQRIGFNAVKRTPSEQIFLLSKCLKEHNIRFIYVPLPCKGAVYPELAVDKKYIPKDGKVIPQWRKMIKELVELDVEVIDVYTKFLEDKNKTMLYSKYHNISTLGGETIANIISEYLVKTTSFSELFSYNVNFIKQDREICTPITYCDDNGYSRLIEVETMESSQILLDVNGKLKPYIGREFDSEIVTIGNCNLQSYLYTGADITSHLSYNLNYPVEYGGRYLPFDGHDRLNRMPLGLLHNKKILLYVGFPSASFVRAQYMAVLWNLDNIQEGVFNKLKTIKEIFMYT